MLTVYLIGCIVNGFLVYKILNTTGIQEDLAKDLLSRGIDAEKINFNLFLGISIVLIVALSWLFLIGALVLNLG